MVRIIFKMGEILVISLPEEMVAQLGDEVSVSVEVVGGRLIVKPKHSAISGIDYTLAKQLEEFMEKYGPALEALSK